MRGCRGSYRWNHERIRCCPNLASRRSGAHGPAAVRGRGIRDAADMQRHGDLERDNSAEASHRAGRTGGQRGRRPDYDNNADRRPGDGAAVHDITTSEAARPCQLREGRALRDGRDRGADSALLRGLLHRGVRCGGGPDCGRVEQPDASLQRPRKIGLRERLHDDRQRLHDPSASDSGGRIRELRGEPRRLPDCQDSSGRVRLPDLAARRPVHDIDEPERAAGADVGVPGGPAGGQLPAGPRVLALPDIPLPRHSDARLPVDCAPPAGSS